MLPVAILILPLATGLACLFARSRRWMEGLNLAGFGAVAALSVLLAKAVLAEHAVRGLGQFLYADALSALVVGLIAFVALVTALYAIGYFREEERAGKVSFAQLRRYYSLAPLFVFAMLLAPLADSIGVMWIAIEGSTLVSVLLVAFYNEKTSLEAAWKFIMIGSVGISLALFGTITTYSAAVKVFGDGAQTKALSWSLLWPVAGQLDPRAMRLAFVCVLLGYGTKAGLAPMHTWKPDAYSEAPIPAVTLLAAGVVNCAIYAIMRFSALAAPCLGREFIGNLLVGFGLGSVLLAAPLVLAQRNLRRLLAYSSIDHAGVMVAALGFGGKLGALGAVLHMLFHAVTKPLAFFCAGNVQQRFGTAFLRKITGAMRVLPWTAGLFMMAALAITGVPPFSMFQSEFLIVSAALQAGRPWAAAGLLAGLATIFAGFFAHISKLCLGLPKPEETPTAECPWKISAMAVTAAVIAGVALWLPGPLYHLVTEATNIVGGAQ
jgi:hydrogenase-4 component F